MGIGLEGNKGRESEDAVTFVEQPRLPLHHLLLREDVPEDQ